MPARSTRSLWPPGGFNAVNLDIRSNGSNARLGRVKAAPFVTVAQSPIAPFEIRLPCAKDVQYFAMLKPANVEVLCALLLFNTALSSACTAPGEAVQADVQTNQFAVWQEPKNAFFRQNVTAPAFIMSPRGTLVPSIDSPSVTLKANQPFTVYGHKQMERSGTARSPQWIQIAISPRPTFIHVEEELVFLTEPSNGRQPRWVATARGRCPMLGLDSIESPRLVPGSRNLNIRTRVFLYDEAPQLDAFVRANFLDLHRATLDHDIYWVPGPCLSGVIDYSTWDFTKKFTDFAGFINQVEEFKDVTFTEQFPPIPELLPLRPASGVFDVSRTSALRALAQSESGRYLVVALEKWGVPKFGFVDPKLVQDRFAGGFKPRGWQTWAFDLGEKYISPLNGIIAIRDDPPSDGPEKDQIMLVATLGHELGHFIDALNGAGHENMMIENRPPVDKPLIVAEQSRIVLEQMARETQPEFPDRYFRKLYQDLQKFMTEVRMYRFYFTFAFEMGLTAKNPVVDVLVNTTDLIEFVTAIETMKMSSFTSIELGPVFFQLARNNPDRLRSLIPDHRWLDPTTPAFWFLPSD